MRFMIIVHATAESEGAATPPDLDPAVMQAMADFHQQLSQAGVLLDAAGLKPSREGWRIRYSDGQRGAAVDGPFAETKELIAGYTLIQVSSREAAMEWARRYPAPFLRGTCEVEIRPLYEEDDFAKPAA